MRGQGEAKSSPKGHLNREWLNPNSNPNPNAKVQRWPSTERHLLMKRRTFPSFIRCFMSTLGWEALPPWKCSKVVNPTFPFSSSDDTGTRLRENTIRRQKKELEFPFSGWPLSPRLWGSSHLWGLINQRALPGSRLSATGLVPGSDASVLLAWLTSLDTASLCHELADFFFALRMSSKPALVLP